ncbi:hypothetical protein ANN_18741 [Periplaneta americana]|uniref:PiggyBac transposable element-derived protein domain-containing protein n=1 Tax=Periplaneta americana TaxID=6978 RepID=A0ABQ8SQP3_PERAM|nr:hypothetical protein ANN_18741 [Periplaneta americana]
MQSLRKEFDIVPVTVNNNKSPVLHVEHSLGLESWCVRHVYCYTYHRLMDARQLRSRREDPAMLARLLSGALLLNPDVTTFWNMRRELMLADRLDVQGELHFTTVLLSRKPKCAEAFAHRKWVIGRLLLEVIRIRKLLVEVDTDSENIGEPDNCEELSHNSESETDDAGVSDSERGDNEDCEVSVASEISNDFYIGKDKETKWNKCHPPRNKEVADNWFCSFPLADELQRKKLTLVGTLRKNKKELPPELVSTQKREIKSSLFAFRENVTAVLYVPKKGKNVILLSSMHCDDTIDPTTGDDKKPEIITLYNMMKAGVDTVDEMCATYSTSRRCRRWPLALFFRLLDIARINAQIIVSSNNPSHEVIRRMFLREVGECLVKPGIRKRVNSQYLTKDLRAKAAKLSGVTEENQGQTSRERAPKPGRCTICLRKKDKKTNAYCCKCYEVMCVKHMKNVCEKCFERDNESGADKEELLEEELQVSQYAADRYPNNYHAWSHRMWCVTHLAPSATVPLFKEWTTSEQWVSSHVSDHSGMQYRQFLLDRLLKLTHPACEDIAESGTRSLQQLLSSSKAIHVSCSQDGDTTHNLKTSAFSRPLGLIASELLLNMELILRFAGHEALWCHRRYLLMSFKKHLSCREIDVNGTEGSRFSKVSVVKTCCAEKEVSLSSCATGSTAHGGKANNHMNTDGVPLEKDQKLSSEELSNLYRDVHCHLLGAVMWHEAKLINSCRPDEPHQQRLAKQHHKWLSHVLKLDMTAVTNP